MGLDTLLVAGFILTILSIPALLAAWADSRPLYFRLGFLGLALACIAYPYIQSPQDYGPQNWVEISVTVAARIIP